MTEHFDTVQSAEGGKIKTLKMVRGAYGVSCHQPTRDLTKHGNLPQWDLDTASAENRFYALRA